MSTSSTNRRARRRRGRGQRLIPGAPPVPGGARGASARRAARAAGVVPAERHHSAARVRPGPTGTGRRPASRTAPGRRRPHERHLVEPLLALEDRAADQAEDALEIRRREHLVVQRDASRTFGPRGEDVKAPLRVGLARPSASRTLVRPVLREHRPMHEPSSVSDGSIEDGHSTSRYGDSDGTPRQASLPRARGSRSTGRTPHRSGSAAPRLPSSLTALVMGGSDSTQLTFTEPRVL